MADEDWRRAERAWRKSPDDPEAVERALAAARRARVAVPYDLFERERTPSRTFASKQTFVVLAETGADEPVEVGETPGKVEVPACRTWWVRPKPAKVTAKVVEEVRREGAPGLSLERAKVDAAGLALLAPLGDQLHGLSLRSCTKLDPGALQVLAALPCLEALDLSGAGGVDEDALERVAALRGLVRLGLDRQKADVDLGPLVGLRSLAALSLVYWKKLGREAAHTLARIPSLVDLDLSSCDKLRDDGVVALARGCPELRRLSVASCDKVADGALEALGGLKKLRDLNLHLCRGVTAAGVGAVAGAPLERLTLEGICTSDVARALRPAAATLRELRASGVSSQTERLDAGGVEALADLGRLERLDLSQHSLEDAALKPLARLERLAELRLSFNDLEGAGLKTLAGLPLRSLNLLGMHALRKMPTLPPTLERLAFSSGHGFMADDLLKVLGRCLALRELAYSSARGLSAAGVAHLPPSLESLDLSHGVTDDAALAAVVELPALRELNLASSPRLTSAGTTALARAPALRRLTINAVVLDLATRHALEERGCELDLTPGH